MQDVFWAEQLLLKDHTEKAFVYSWGCRPPLPLLLPNNAGFSSDVVLCRWPNEYTAYKVLSKLLPLGSHLRVTKPLNQRHPGWREKPRELFGAAMGLTAIWATPRPASHSQDGIGHNGALLSVNMPALPLFQWSTKKNATDTWEMKLPPSGRSPHGPLALWDQVSGDAWRCLSWATHHAGKGRSGRGREKQCQCSLWPQGWEVHRLVAFSPLCRRQNPCAQNSFWLLKEVISSLLLIYDYPKAVSLWPSRKDLNFWFQSNYSTLLLPLHYSCPLSNQKIAQKLLYCFHSIHKIIFFLSKNRADD